MQPEKSKKVKKSRERILIGRREEIAFPELNLEGITAKVDTGAFTTALHCFDIYEMREGKEKVLCFKLLDPTHPLFVDEEVQTRKYTRRKIKSSTGQFEKRFIIKTKLVLAGKEFETEVSLTDRANMKCPVLLGRRVLKGFLIDVSRINLSKKNKIVTI
jgi:hypothetical protein